MRLTSCFLLLAIGPLPTAWAQRKEDPAHEEIRRFMKDLLTAFHKGETDKLIAALEENVVVTWQNANVNKGTKEVKAYLDEITKGPKRVIDKSSINPVPDDLCVLYNDGKTAVAWGGSADHYRLIDGTEFDQDVRWSATLVKKDAQWKVASVHISVNVLDNPVLHRATNRTSIAVSAIAGSGGIFLGLIGASLLFRRRS